MKTKKRKSTHSTIYSEPLSTEERIFTIPTFKKILPIDETKKHIHFIGIGGIGVSSLARFYMAKGHRVTGSDLHASEITNRLTRDGATLHMGAHKGIYIPKEANIIIYTAAIPSTNSELKTALKRGIIVKTYAQAIGDLTQQYRTITISGSHGKSTTTALSALVLEDGYYDPMVIIGTKLNEFGGLNFRNGRGTYLLLEADEWNKSFLHYYPEIAIATNIDAEHLDTYGTVEEVERAFQNYLEKIPQHGKIIANRDNERLHKIGKKFGMKVRWYSLKDPEANLVRSILRIPGDHNVSNALAALNLGRHLGIGESHILQALGRFTGAWRRFEFMGFSNDAFIFNDYGHHPSEIIATLRATRVRFPFRRILCVYQPHQYQRLQHLWNDFIRAFDLADQILMLPVYDVAGRETDAARTSVNSEKLVLELINRGKQAEHSVSFNHAKQWIQHNSKQGDVVMIMGAGDIYDLAKEITCLENK